MRSRLEIRHRVSVLVAITIALVVTFSSVSAEACLVGVQFNEETIDHAEVIFRGRATAYEVFPNEFSVAKLTFNVEETYRGTTAETWVAVWQNSTFGIPDNLADFVNSHGSDIVVGLAPPGSIGPMDAPSAAIIGPKNPIFWELPWVIQSPCAPPFMGRYSRFEAALRNHGVIE